MRLAIDSFRVQAALIAIASLSMAAVAIVLVRDALSSAEQRLLVEAEQQCRAAVRELAQQYDEQAGLADEPAEALPFGARDMSLRGLSATVLRGYGGVEGGFFFVESSRWAGLAAPTVGSETPQEPDAAQLAELVARTGDSVASNTQGSVADAFAATGSPGVLAWVRKRVTQASDPSADRRRWALAGLVLLALMGLAGVVSISIRLRRGVEQLNAGLATLEEDFSYRLPPTGDEFGRLAAAVNQMAARRAELESTVRRQDRLAALGKVVAGVAHEIRNPLNSIRLTLELLRRRLQKGEARGTEVAEAMGEVDRLDRILSRLLAFGKPSPEDRRPQPIAPILDRTVKMIQDQALSKSLDLRVEGLRHDDDWVDIDAFEIEQVLLNLLLNAIDASPPGGQIAVRAQRNGEALEVQVADQGAGVPADVGEHIFDPYFTTKQSGAGLGLAVSREIALRHGGELSFENQSTGAVFVLRLPAPQQVPA